MALNGLRPVPEIQFGDFIYPAVDQLINEAAKYRKPSLGGRVSCPIVVRTGRWWRQGGHYHSQSPESRSSTCTLRGSGGLPKQSPTPKGSCAAIRDNDPVLFFEPKRVYRALKMDVPEGDYVVPLSSAKVVREGGTITLVAWGAMLLEALAAAEEAVALGIEVEVIDLRTLWPLDTGFVIGNVKKTGRTVIVRAPGDTAWSAG